MIALEILIFFFFHFIIFYKVRGTAFDTSLLRLMTNLAIIITFLASIIYIIIVILRAAYKAL
jgi:hypothetical protein